MYHNYFENSYARELLAKSIPCDMVYNNSVLVSAEEVDAIKNNLLYISYKDIQEPKEMPYIFISYDRILKYIDETVNYILNSGILYV